MVYVDPCLSSPDEAGPASKVIVCSTGSPFTQRTVWPAWIVTVAGSLNAATRISVTPGSGVLTAAAGAALFLNQGEKRLRCSGMVNSNPYSRFGVPRRPRELP